MMDQDGFVALSAVGNVAARARVPLEAAETAIRTLENPDVLDPSQEHEGRRIERVPYGWVVLNSKKYRDIIKSATAREQTRERVARHRAKKKHSNENVTHSNENVTPSEAEAEAEAEAETYTPTVKTTCAEPRAATAPVFCIPLVDKTEFPISKLRVDDWIFSFPAVDVPQALINMRQWAIANPTKRKTKRGVERFIVSWLTREQDKPRTGESNGPHQQDKRSRAQKVSDKLDEIARQDIAANGFTSELD